MEIPTFDIELIVSGKAAKFFRLKPTVLASAEPVHFLAQWRVELAEDGFGHKLFLVTNGATVFSILIPLEPKMRFEQLAEQFLMRLRFVLLGVTPAVEWKSAQVQAVRGGNRSLIGTMNNMVYLLSVRTSRSCTLPEQEDILNDTPFFAIPEVFPHQAFFARLGDVPPLSRGFDLPSSEDPDAACTLTNVTTVMQGLEQHLREAQGSPADQAQQLYYDAMEASSAREEFSLLKRALQMDPENVDARRAILEHRRLSPASQIEELRKIVAIAERRLGPATFQECKGVFWGYMETRPYMRARAQLAECLHSLGHSHEAIAEWKAMLELNPNDNQGMRYFLLAELLARSELEAAREILARYPECEFSTLFAWCRVLERFLSRDLAGAEQALLVARKQNGWTEAYIKGQKRLPDSTVPAYSPGSREEAVCFAESLHRTWAKYSEALKWLNTRPRGG